MIIPTDGRDHPKNPDPTWMGNSVGRWEGDTLVVDSIGFNDKTRLDTIGHPHSDQLHVIQRFSRADPMHLAYEVTVDDPIAYTKPFDQQARLHAEAEVGADGVFVRGKQQRGYRASRELMGHGFGNRRSR